MFIYLRTQVIVVLWLFLLLCKPALSPAQNVQSKLLFNKSNDALIAGNIDSSLVFLKLAINEELKQKKKTDSNFVFNCYKEYALRSRNYKFEYVDYLKNAVDYYLRKNDDSAYKYLPILFKHSYLHEVGVYDSIYYNSDSMFALNPTAYREPVNWDTTVNKTFVIQNIYRRTAGSNSQEIKISGGSWQGLFEGGKISVYRLKNKKYPKLKKIASGTITSVSKYFSYATVEYLNPDSADLDTIKYNNVIYAKARTEKKYEGNMQANLQNELILLTSIYLDKYYFGTPISKLYANEKCDKIIIDNIIEDCKFTYNINKDDTLEEFHTVVKAGMFKGLKNLESLLYQKDIDIKFLLEYLYEYSGSYFGQRKKIAQLAYNWVISENYIPDDLTDKYTSLALADLLKQKTDGHFRQIVYAVNASDKKMDSVLLDKIYVELANKPESKITCFKTMQDFYLKQNDVKNWTKLTYNLANELYAQKKYNESYVEYKSVLTKNSDSVNRAICWYYFSAVFAMTNRYEESYKNADSALNFFPYYTDAKNMKAWMSLMTNKVDQAYNMTKELYEYDSSVYSYLVNFGHALILKQNKKSANRLYKKAMDLYETNNSFYGGVIVDLNMFINANINKAEFTSVKNDLISLYQQKYEYKITTDSFRSAGLKFHGRKQYEYAISNYKLALEREQKSKEKRTTVERSCLRYIAHSYYKSTNYKEAFKYYKTAWEFTKANNYGDEEIVYDLEDVTNMCDWLNDTFQLLYYKSELEALRYKISETKVSKKLFVLSIAPNTVSKEDSFNISDSKLFSTTVGKLDNTEFSKVYNFNLTGKLANKKGITQMIDSIADLCSSNDVFIFHFAGHTSSSNNGFFQLEDKNIHMKNLFIDFEVISAKKQLYLMDCNGLNWSEISTSDFGFTDRKSVIVMGYTSSRRYNDKRNAGLLSETISEVLLKVDQIGSLTAQELVSKVQKQFYIKQNYSSLQSLFTGSDFIIAKTPVKFGINKDTVGPNIEVFGAIKTRSKNIEIEGEGFQGKGRITDESKIKTTTINNVKIKIQNDGYFTIPQELMNQKIITIVSIDTFGNPTTKIFELPEQQKKTSVSKKFVYLIATGKYSGEWPDLGENPINDAKNIGEILENYYGYEVINIFNYSKDSLKDFMDDVQYKKDGFGEKDQVVFYFAGHGHYDTENNRGFYVTKNSNSSGDLKNMIKQTDIASWANELKPKNVLLIFDICFGAMQFYPKRMLTGVENSTDEKVENFINEKLDIKCREILASGHTKVPNVSMFALRLGKSLESTALSGKYITVGKLFADIEREALGTRPMIKQFGDDSVDSEFVFSVKHRKREEKAGLVSN